MTMGDPMTTPNEVKASPAGPAAFATLEELEALQKRAHVWHLVDPPEDRVAYLERGWFERLLATAKAGLEDRERLDWSLKEGWVQLPDSGKHPNGQMLWTRADIDAARNTGPTRSGLPSPNGEKNG